MSRPDGSRRTMAVLAAVGVAALLGGATTGAAVVLVTTPARAAVHVEPASAHRAVWIVHRPSRTAAPVPQAVDFGLLVPPRR